MIESIKLDIAAAIEAKGVSMSGVSFPDYPSAIASISGGGGGYTEAEMTEGVAVNLSNSASYVGSYAFNMNSNIQTINLPNATTVGNMAFQSCTALTQVSLPVCEYVGQAAFESCTSLSQINLPVCSYVGNITFRYCSSLTQVSLPVCSYVAATAFYSCTSLSQVSLPVCSYIGGWAFQSTALTQVSLPICSYIGESAFYYCTSLSRITLGYSGVCSLFNSYTFRYTQITSSAGSIYVPASLVDTYKSAQNWSYFSSIIFPIE